MNIGKEHRILFEWIIDVVLVNNAPTFECLEEKTVLEPLSHITIEMSISFFLAILNMKTTQHQESHSIFKMYFVLSF